MSGKFAARGLRYTYDRLKIEGATAQGLAEISQKGISVRQMIAKAFDSTITGQADLEDWRRIHVEGSIEGLDLRRAAATVTDRPVAWNGTLSGPFAIDTTLSANDALAHVNFNIAPGSEGTSLQGAPVQGTINATYDQAAGTIA